MFVLDLVYIEFFRGWFWFFWIWYNFRIVSVKNNVNRDKYKEEIDKYLFMRIVIIGVFLLVFEFLDDWCVVNSS